MNDYDDDILEEFKVNAYEMLDECEEQLLAVEKGSGLEQCYNPIFNVFHSLKGAAGMVGFDMISERMHKMEDVFTTLRDAKSIPQQHLDLFFRGIDQVRALLGGEQEVEDLVIQPPQPPEKDVSPPPKPVCQGPGNENPYGKAEIMVIDDEEGALRLLRMMLQDNYVVHTYSDPLVALENFKTKPPQLVISDIKMPGFDGMELLQLLTDRDPDVPVVLITGHASKELAIESINKGPFYFIEKPFKREELLSGVRKALFRRMRNYLHEARRHALHKKVA